MTLRAVDASGHPTPAAIKAAGFVALGQYLTGHGFTITYARALTNAGVDIISIYETGATSAASGAGQGSADGKAAVAAAQLLKQPLGTAIYATVDFDLTAAQTSIVYAYLSAFAQIVRAAGYLFGVYGGVSTLQVAAPLKGIAWQAAGWSAGATYAQAALVQQLQQTTIAGTTCDVDILSATPGAWNLNGKTVLISSQAKEASMVTSPSTGGILVARSDGSVYAYDGAGFYNSLPGLNVKPAAPIVGIASTTSGKGYWLVGADGGVFAFGDAQYHGPAPRYLDQWGIGVGHGAAAPIIGITNGHEAGIAYTIVATNGGAQPMLYRIPSSGTFAS